MPAQRTLRLAAMGIPQLDIRARAAGCNPVPDGNWIATGSPGTDIKLWNAHSGEPQGALSGHAAEVSALMFSPDGQRLASGDDRGHVRMWKLETGVVRGSPDPARATTEGLPTEAARRPAVGGVARSGDRPQQGRWVFERDLTGHTASITALRFTPDGRRLV